jgi:hypothetical protein
VATETNERVKSVQLLCSDLLAKHIYGNRVGRLLLERDVVRPRYQEIRWNETILGTQNHPVRCESFGVCTIDLERRAGVGITGDDRPRSGGIRIFLTTGAIAEIALRLLSRRRDRYLAYNTLSQQLVVSPCQPGPVGQAGQQLRPR